MSTDLNEELPELNDEALETEGLGETTSEQIEQVSGNSFRGYFESRGVPVPEGVDDNALYDYTLKALETYNKLGGASPEELFEYRARYQQEKPESATHTSGQQFRSAQEAQAASQKTEAVSDSPAYLDFPKGADAYCQFNKQTGLWVAKDPQFPNIKAIEALNSWQRQQEEIQRDFSSNPVKFFNERVFGEKDRKSLADQIRQQVIDEIRQEQSKQQHSSQLEGFWQKNGKELVLSNPDGSWKYDLFGNPVLTRKGQEFQKAYEQAQQFGIQDQYKATEFAWTQVASRYKRQAKAGNEQQGEVEQAAEVEAPEPTAEDIKKQHVAAAKAADANGKRTIQSQVQNKGASVAAAAASRVPQNAEVALKQQMQAKFKAAGVSLET